MKKVMIGILILIPIIILLIVAAVSNIVSVQAWVGVEDIQLFSKGTSNRLEGKSVVLELDNVNGKDYVNLNDYVDIVVMPEKANNYAITWSISGEVECQDKEYEKEYEDYLQQKEQNPDDNLLTVYPAACMYGGSNPDGSAKEVQSNNTGYVKISSYCTFEITVRAETITKIFFIEVIGYDVKSVDIMDERGEESAPLVVGQSMRLTPNYTPLNSIVQNAVWETSDDDVATVDANGTVTAVGAGQADITLKASVYSKQGEFVQSKAYTLTVQKGVSKYGDKLVTASRRIALNALDIDAATVQQGQCRGLTIEGDEIVVAWSGARLVTTEGTLEIGLCGEDDIRIQNGEKYNFESDGDFVLAVGATPLKLTAVYCDMLRTDTPQNVTWSTSPATVASVSAQGEVSGLDVGIVTVTASCAGHMTSINVNVQKKVATVRLVTSDASLAQGIARQTVFASECFETYETVDAITLKPNSLEIVLQGQPVGKEDLLKYLEAYKFEFTEGAEYAEFSAEQPNVVVFNNAMEGKGVVSVKVKVSAKYPLYLGMPEYTTDEVTLNVVYGVAVDEIKQLHYATELQATYINDVNAGKSTYEDAIVIEAPIGMTYVSRHCTIGQQNYAICVMDDIDFVKGNNFGARNSTVVLMGNLYGNGHILRAGEGALNENEFEMCLGANHLTLSNLRMSANPAPNDGTISDADDTVGFKGRNLVISYDPTYFAGRLTDIRIEYCLLENSARAADILNADVDFDGCVVRNVNSCAFYVPAQILDDYFFVYSHIGFNNCIFSNMVASVTSISYDGFTIYGQEKQGRFVANDRAENERWFKENVASKGINIVINQTGFMDIYNWVDVEKASLIKIGNTIIDNFLKVYTTPFLKDHQDLKDMRYVAGDKTYFHLGLTALGVSTSNGLVLDEPVYLEFNHTDNRFVELYTKDITDDPKEATDSFLKAAHNFLKGCELHFYCYSNKANIVPNQIYVLENQIGHLHGEN